MSQPELSPALVRAALTTVKYPGFSRDIVSFGLVKDMDERGKVVNVAFAVSAAFVFGDHLGFAAGFAPESLLAMIAGKLAGGISAVAVALLLTRKKQVLVDK